MPMEELKETVERLNIRIGIITVPDFEEQRVADLMIEERHIEYLGRTPRLRSSSPRLLSMLRRLRRSR